MSIGSWFFNKRALWRVQAASENLLLSEANLDAVYRKESGGIRNTSKEVVQKIEEDIGNILKDAGLWAAPWDSPVWEKYQLSLSPPEFLRVGTFNCNSPFFPKISVPAFLPFACDRTRKNLTISVIGEAKKQAAEAVQSLLWRILATTPPAKAKLLLLDPVGLGQNVAPLLLLADKEKELIGTKAWTESSDIEKQLANMTQHMEMVIQKYLRNQYPTIEEYNRKAAEVEEPYRIVVVMNFPVGFNEQSARRLVSIATNGPRCGVYTVVTVDREQPTPHGFDIKELYAESSVIWWNSGKGFHWSYKELEEIPFSFDTPPSQRTANMLAEKIGDAARLAARIELPFTKIAPVEESWWKQDCVEELRIAIGRKGAGSTQELVLGKKSPHALVVGRTGMGKSTLMHILVTGLAMKYSPEELELYLIDFKKGVEFKVYASTGDRNEGLPHARIIAIESEPEFGLSCLRKAIDEYNKRGALFREHNCASIEDYRTKTNAHLPRILIMIDEFQMFFTEDESLSQQATQYLDLLARQGRVFGIHLFLGSQTLGRCRDLPKSTIDQFQLRIALPCSEEDSTFVIGDISAHTLLKRQGEAMYNDAAGLKDGNTRFQVAWQDEAERKNIIGTLHAYWKKVGKAPLSPPVIFEGNKPANLAENEAFCKLVQSRTYPPSQRVISAWLGQPVAIKEYTSARFFRQEGRNLLVMGRDEITATAVVLTALASLAIQFSPKNAIFYLLDLTTADAEWADHPEALRDALPHKVELSQKRSIAETLKEVVNAIEIRKTKPEEGKNEPPVFVAGIGLHRAKDLRKEDDYSFGTSDGKDSLSPGKMLSTILRDGPEVGVHVIAWWDSYANLERSLERQAIREFGIRIALPMSAPESASLLDDNSAAKLGSFRALFQDDEQPGVLEKFIPYGLPSKNWFADLGLQLRKKVTGVENVR